MPCPPHYAYLYPDQTADAVRASEHYRRVLRPASLQWSATQLPQGCLMALPGGEPRLGAYGPPQSVSDADDTDGSVQFLPPPDLPWIIETAGWRALVRAAHPPAITVDTCAGHAVSVALGLAAPSSVIVGGGRARRGDAITELGQLAWATYDEYQAARTGGPPAPLDDTARLGWLVFLALQACYHLTTDMVNACQILTDADLTPLLTAVWGADPKALPAADATSASSAAAS